MKLLREPSSTPKLVESIQSLIAERSSAIDVRVRCKDHQPSDGLGAHRLILAAASPNYLKEMLLQVDSDELICLHLPDYTSIEVGPVMSLLYYGETWIDESHAQVCQDILQDLKIAVQFQDQQDTKKVIKSEPVEDIKKDIKIEPLDEEQDSVTTQTSTPNNEIIEDLQAEVSCSEPSCSYKTSSLSSMQSHRLIHARRAQRLQQRRTCPACHQTFQSPKETRDHALQAHSETLEDECVHCILDYDKCTWTSSVTADNLSLSFFQHLNEEHVVEEKEDIPRMLVCDFPGCSYTTPKGYNMTQHIRGHNEERRHQCPVCPELKAFLSSSHLRDHIKAVHTKERTFQCPKCPRAFATSWQAQSHIKTNHGQKSLYKCSQCSKNYKTPQALAGHVKSSHKAAKSRSPRAVAICDKCGEKMMKNHTCQSADFQLKLTKCQICQKEMTNKALKAHMQYHRKKQVSQYLCQFCNKNFTTETSLKRHILIHENSKPFSCPMCEKTFRQKSSLTAHQRIHSGTRFNCQQCKKQFITKSLLTKHVKTAH